MKNFSWDSVKAVFGFRPTTRKKRKLTEVKNLTRHHSQAEIPTVQGVPVGPMNSAHAGQSKTPVATAVEAVALKRARKDIEGKVQARPVVTAFVGPVNASLPIAKAYPVAPSPQKVRARTSPATPSKSMSRPAGLEDSPATRVNKMAKALEAQAERIRDVTDTVQDIREKNAMKRLESALTAVEDADATLMRKLKKGEHEGAIKPEQTVDILREVRNILNPEASSQAAKVVPVASAIGGGKPLKATPNSVMDSALGMPSATTASKVGLFSGPKYPTARPASTELPPYR